MALYDKTISFILRYIDEQQLEPGARLPTENELATMTGVSLVTVRRALSELAAQGVVRREQGRGTFLARSRVRTETARPGSLRGALHLDVQSRLETRLLGMERRGASDAESKALSISPGAAVWEIGRLRLLNGQPMILETSVIPVIHAPDLERKLTNSEEASLYGILEHDYGLRDEREEQTLVCRPAMAAEVKALELLKFDWVVDLSGVSYASARTPIDCFRMIFDAKRFAFRIESPSSSALEAVELLRYA